MDRLNRDLDDAREVQRGLRDLLDTHGRRGADEYALEEVRRLCTLASITVADALYQKELHELERYATYLFSPDAKRRRRVAGGSQRLRALTSELLNALGRRLDHLETHRFVAKVQNGRQHLSISPRRRF